MEQTCCQCETRFTPAYVYQLAITKQKQRMYFCSLPCRESALGTTSFHAKRARRIAILNQKGGTGKTTTAVNVAAGVAQQGYKVLLIDSDAQGNVGVSLGIRGESSLYHVLVENLDPEDAAVPVRASLDVITANETLAAAEIWLAQLPVAQRSRILSKRFNLRKISSRYDYVVIDCGPSLSLLNQNALSYVDEVVIPVTCDYLALVGVKQVMKTLRNVEKHLSHSVNIAGVLPTFYDARTRLGNEVLSTLRGHFKEKCLNPVRMNTRLAEAPSHKKTIFEYAPNSNGAADYSHIVEWMIDRVQPKTSQHAA